MRTLKLHVPDAALPPWDPFVQQTKEARVFRRAQAVRAVVQGQRLPTVSDTLQLTYSALRQWVQRWAHPGTQGLIARARAGRPPPGTCALAMPRNISSTSARAKYSWLIKSVQFMRFTGSGFRGYPETFSHCCSEIKQHSDGNEMQGDRRDRAC